MFQIPSRKYTILSPAFVQVASTLTELRLEMETVKFLSFAVKCPVQSIVEWPHYIYLITVPARLPEVCRGSEDARELVLTR